MRYQRNIFGFLGATTAVQITLFALVATYLVFGLISRTVAGQQIISWLVLDPIDVTYGFQIWRLVTYAFLHDLGDPLHLIFNAMMFYFLAPELEHRWGDRKFFIFVALSAIAGGVFVCVAWIIGLTAGHVIGFSAVTLGLLVAWGLSFPERMIYFFGVVPLTGRHLIWLTLGTEILFAFSRSNVSTAAHLGGMAMGAIFTLWRPSRLKRISY